MAKCEITLPEELQKKLDRLGRQTDEITAKALEAGAEATLPYLRSSLKDVIGKDTKYESRSTGELIRSLGISPVMVDREGSPNIKVGFNEPRRVQRAAKGKRSYYTATNAMLANILEYGKVLEYGKHGQPPKPFLKQAKNRSRKAAAAAMQKAFDEEVEKL